MDLRRKGHGSQSTMSRCVKAATKLRLEHASPRLSEQGCGEQKKCRKGPARDSPRISAYPTAGKTNSPRLIPAASNPLPPTSSYSDQKKSPPKDFCPLTNPQPYQRDRDKPRQGVVANTLNAFRCGDVGFIDFHEKAFKLKMKFISLGGVRFGIGLPCGLGCRGPGLDPI